MECIAKYSSNSISIPDVYKESSIRSYSRNSGRKQNSRPATSNHHFNPSTTKSDIAVSSLDRFVVNDGTHGGILSLDRDSVAPITALSGKNSSNIDILCGSTHTQKSSTKRINQRANTALSMSRPPKSKSKSKIQSFSLKQRVNFDELPSSNARAMTSTGMRRHKIKAGSLSRPETVNSSIAAVNSQKRNFIQTNSDFGSLSKEDTIKCKPIYPNAKQLAPQQILELANFTKCSCSLHSKVDKEDILSAGINHELYQNVQKSVDFSPEYTRDMNLTRFEAGNCSKCDKIVHIDCGAFHSIAVSANGTILTW